MSYQVLARKYRPRSFEELVGQEHVVQALANALTQQRLHHAYLFTGTRGVGKTTVSRILAKSLNCTGPDGQGGITAHPCGQCAACRDIDSGRFVDYVELDAASNRGVEEISQLLDQAVYKPVVGRFKVYMIDEVHMLSNTAFNAMLKTLEEPPEYLKFVLATTDPQKVPVTVLSRCLQFNLRPMAPQTVLEHLTRVLSNEGVPAEPGALRLLARAARGSMRDALSLTDQAIAFGSGQLAEPGVRQMLGSVDRGHVLAILNALIAGDGAAVVAASDRLRDMGLAAAGTLEDLAVALQTLAVAQVAPGALDAQDPDLADLLPLAARLPADELQLMYSMALHGRQELPLAPDEYAGLTMVLLRMLAFRPEGAPVQRADGGLNAAATPAPAATARPAAAPLLRSQPPAVAVAADRPQPAATPVAEAPQAPVPLKAEPVAPTEAVARPNPAPEPVLEPAAALAPPPAAVAEAEAAAVAVAEPVEPPEAQAPVAVAEPTREEAPAAPSPVAAAPVPARPASRPEALSAEPPARRFSDRLRPRVAAPAVSAEDEEPSAAPMGDEPPPWLDGPPPMDEELSAGTGAGEDLALEASLPDGGPDAGGGIYVSTAGDEVALEPTPLGERWAQLLPQLGLSALTRELALQAQCIGIDEQAQPPLWRLRVERESLRQPALKDKLQAALAAHLGHALLLEIEAGRATDSPALRDTMAARARQRHAESLILEDPEVRELLASFKTARILPGSIKPV
ncbi:DNA polymerase III subunit gamma/tau [Pelomonas sp. CA6]|uniref:DNA polymerase III subunit gamma/tau n=1 Tax=Pelomonas sp. CA6 TaxID=2907999 RepID=UPI001F4B0029|nr:DNA polymerase III subunit gamma/tau [Pelomonas sp. CA6]MCH7342209.1 DNA polymerase III subunit gamma/tau [Pelomonas sp. CA6]